VALEKQVPPDLPACLALGVAGAGVARKYRVEVRDGWTEPLNLYFVVALPPGERKSSTFADATCPVGAFEREEQMRMAPIIAEAESARRILEQRMKAAEAKAAKQEEAEERDRLKAEAKALARELSEHVVPNTPRALCDDATPERVAQLLAQQGGRMLQASAEGTLFEIAKGRYSEGPNFDVFLKAHAGDRLCVDRIGREGEGVDRPALSVALSVQPDVIAGLVAEATLKRRGFLARFLYSLPVSRVGNREVGAPAVPAEVAQAYHENTLALWRTPYRQLFGGLTGPHVLRFMAGADLVLRALEREIEPQLAEGEELSLLAGWANKLAGACARIAGVLHLAQAVADRRPLDEPVTPETVTAAVAIGRDYFLPHAKAAFRLMGADERAEKARQCWEAIRRRLASECAEYSESAPPRLSRRDIHQANRRLFPEAQQLDPVLDLLADVYYLRPLAEHGAAPGRGAKSPVYEVNPKALAIGQDEAPRTHCTH
jgi:hypothetical protein